MVGLRRARANEQNSGRLLNEQTNEQIYSNGTFTSVVRSGNGKHPAKVSIRK